MQNNTDIDDACDGPKASSVLVPNPLWVDGSAHGIYIDSTRWNIEWNVGKDSSKEKE